MEDFPANSAKARARSEGPPPDRTEERPKKVERVTSAEAVRRKRGLGRQFKETFIGGSARGALDAMFLEVVVPSIRDLMAEAVHAVTDKVIYGDTRPRRGVTTSSYSNVGHVNYQGMSSHKPPTTRSLSQRSRTRHDFGEIVINSRREAEEVLDRMYDILSRYGSVPVADLYELTGIQSSHVDHKWGWTSLRGAKVSSLRTGGYLMDLPNPEPLDR
jgi:hypothetical protein